MLNGHDNLKINLLWFFLPKDWSDHLFKKDPVDLSSCLIFILDKLSCVSFSSDEALWEFKLLSLCAFDEIIYSWVAVLFLFCF